MRTKTYIINYLRNTTPSEDLRDKMLTGALATLSNEFLSAGTETENNGTIFAY